MSLARVLKCVPSFFLLFIFVSASYATWAPDGIAFSTAANNQGSPLIISDGAGGSIFVWTDGRSGDLDVYAQRVDARGIPLWAIDGVAVSTATNNQYAHAILSDGAGGAIIALTDYRNGNADIYAQRLDASGNPLWTPGGIAVCTAADIQREPRLVSDDADGAIIVWEDRRAGMFYDDIYAQRVNGSGSSLWTSDGVVVSAAAEYQIAHAVASDGAGGVIVAWYDFRGGVDHDVYAQRLNGSGVSQWIDNGVAICTAAGEQDYPLVAMIGESAIVNADLRANSVVISGRVTGEVISRRRVEIRARGQLCGEVTTPSLIVHEGALFDGRCSVSGCPVRPGRNGPTTWCGR